MNQSQVVRDLDRVMTLLDRVIAAVPEEVRETARARPLWDSETGRRAVQKRWQNARQRAAALKGQEGDDGAA
jgi:hypothetical protein